MSGQIAETPRRQRGRWISFAINLAVLLAWAWFLRGQLDALRGMNWQVTPAALLGSIVLGAGYFVALALGWALLLRRMSGKPIRTGAAARVWLASMLTRYLPGNVWHILSRTLLAEQLGVSKTQVLSSSTVEQVLTLVGALLVVGGSLPFWPTLGGYAPLLLLVPVGLLALHPRLLGRLLGWLALRVGRPALVWRYRMTDILAVTACYVGAFVLHGLGLLALLGGMTPLQVGHIPAILGAAALAWALGFLSFFTPSGLGVREAVLAALLVQLYPQPVALAAALLFRLTQTLGEAAALAGAWLLERRPA